MHRTHDPGTTDCMEGTPAANKLFMPEPTVNTTQVSNTIDLFTDDALA